MKAIVIIPIAERKAAKRGIKKQWIEEVLREPSQREAGYGGRNVAQKRLKIAGKEYLLRVVYEDSEEAYVVITAYLTSQVERYWKEEDR